MEKSEGEIHDRVRSALGTGAPFGVSSDDVDVIETHIAVVFLVGDRAYKMKKPVSFGYLDFTGLETRREILDKERRLNSRTAPELYLRVLPVTEEPSGAYALEGAGPIVEWLLEMVRFDQADLLVNRVGGRDPAGFSHMVDDWFVSRERGFELAEELTGPLGQAVAAMHRDAHPCRQTGWVGALERVVAEMTGHLRAGIGWALDADRVARFAERALHALIDLRGPLEERARTGFVRLCHGDLHLSNIVVLEGRPVPFDCIEFNDEIACQDTLYDLSFLLMDLALRGRRDFASRVFNAYLAALDAQEFEAALEGLVALPFYAALRAAIRAHVSLARVAGQGDSPPPPVDEPGRQAAIHEARAYLRLALTLLEPPKPALLAVGGLSGSGKSTLARDVASVFVGPAGAVILRSDEIRKRTFGVAVTDQLPDQAYAPVVNGRVYNTLEEEARAALSAGCPVVLDAVFARPEQRLAVERLAASLGVPFTGFWLEADPTVMAARIRGRRDDASDATEAVLRRQLDFDLGEITWTRIDSGADRDTVRQRATSRLMTLWI